MQLLTWNMAGNTRSAARRSDRAEWLGSHSQDVTILQEAPEFICLVERVRSRLAARPAPVGHRRPGS